MRDCGDGSDEDGALCRPNSPLFACGGDTFKCAADAKCIRRAWVCDAGVDCPADAADERGCPGKPEPFLCLSDGRFVYVTGYSGTVYCFKAGEGDEGSWPMFRGNAARTGIADGS